MAESLSSSLHDLDLYSEQRAPDDPQATTQDLVDRCRTLHEEVEKYVAAVDQNQKDAKIPYRVEYRTLRNDFKNELAFLSKLKDQTLSVEKARHYAVSSNLVYYEALWAAAKRSSGLLSFRKYFFWNKQKEGHKMKGLSLAKGSQTKGKSAALVDIVAGDGTEWVRVSTISEKRLLFDLAKLGWQNDSDSDEDIPEAPNSNWEDDDDDDQVDIVKNARELARAARANTIRGHSPKVRIVLTRIQSGKLKEVDMILNKMRATGATVQCANEIPAPLSLEAVLPNLLIDRSRTLSETLNIDCTILLALISDISHSQCPILDWYPGEVRAQILEEEKEKLLPTHLYPAISAHPMVCTQEAADQMNLIVDTLATDNEKVRANLLLAQRDHENSSPEDLVKEWDALSDHTVPGGLQLPIKVVPSNLDHIIGKPLFYQAMNFSQLSDIGQLRRLTRTETLPAAAKKIAAELSPLNTAIFFYGWAEGLTTLSSNRARARQIEHLLNENGLEDGEAGPHIWLCGESRSLIAKHGRRK